MNMKNLISNISLVFVFVLGVTGNMYSQCTNSTAYMTATAPSTPGTVTQISTCTYQSEYNTINSVQAGETYISTYSLGGCITVTQRL